MVFGPKARYERGCTSVGRLANEKFQNCIDLIIIFSFITHTPSTFYSSSSRSQRD